MGWCWMVRWWNGGMMGWWKGVGEVTRLTIRSLTELKYYYVLLLILSALTPVRQTSIPLGYNNITTIFRLTSPLVVAEHWNSIEFRPNYVLIFHRLRPYLFCLHIQKGVHCNAPRWNNRIHIATTPHDPSHS